MKTATLRFVTIRNPEPSHRTVSALPFDPVILKTSGDYAGSLYQKLDDIHKNASLKPAEKIKAIKDAVQAFKSSTSFISDAQQFDSLYPGFMELREWLVTRRSLTLNDLHREAERILHLSASRTLAAKQLLNLTDNLIAYVITDGDPVLREKISLVLRMNNVVQKAATVRGAADLRKLINAPVILPDVVFLPVVREKEPTTEPQQDPAAERRENWEKLNQFSTAHDELAAALNVQIDPERAAQPKPQSAGFFRTFLSRFLNPDTAPPESARNDVALSSLRPEHLASLSTETKDVLSELQITEGTKFPDALAKVERSAQKIAAQIGSSISPYTEQVLIGNTLVNRSDLPGPVFASEGSELPVNGECEFRFPFKIADLRVVVQELKDYLAGEIAHVENILQGELKERSTRRLKSTEETVFTSEEHEETNEKDTQTTNRFQLEQEISKTAKQDSELRIDAKVDTQYYGYVNVQTSATAGFSMSNSEEQSTRDAVSYANSVVKRSAQKIIERVKLERTVNKTEVFEENNRHLLNNLGGQHHVVGVYRWLDQEFRVWLKNEGKRLMFEVLIPEPGAFNVYAMTQKKDDLTGDLKEPIPPNDPEFAKKLGITPLSSYKDITALNYPIWAAAYGAEVTPPPPTSLTITAALAKTDQTIGDYMNSSADALTVPKGYFAQTCSIVYEYHSGPLNGHTAWGTAVVGLKTFSGTKSGVSMNAETGTIPVSMEGYNVRMLLHVEVVCSLLPEALDEWKIKTYKAIYGAYESKRSEYENALAEARAGAGVVIRGTNPLFNETVIRTELKKNAIRLMAHCNPMYSSAMTDSEGDFDCCQVMKEAPYVTFVEQVFEWGDMVFEFYPYHWAAKSHWTNLYNLSDTDPLFQSFLKAGYARVLVPVTPGYNNAAMNFIKLGTPDLHDLASQQVMDIINGMDEDEPTLAPARVSTQSNINIANPPATIDGVALTVGDRVLVRNQGKEPENGVYIWNGSGVAMPRATDADDAIELAQAVIEVTEGTDKDFKFRQTELPLTTIETDPIIFRVAAEIINESLLIPTELTILECQSAGVEPTTMKILGLCQTVGTLTPILNVSATSGTTPDVGGH